MLGEKKSLDTWQVVVRNVSSFNKYRFLLTGRNKTTKKKQLMITVESKMCSTESRCLRKTKQLDLLKYLPADSKGGISFFLFHQVFQRDEQTFGVLQHNSVVSCECVVNLDAWSQISNLFCFSLSLSLSRILRLCCAATLIKAHVKSYCEAPLQPISVL